MAKLTELEWKRLLPQLRNIKVERQKAAYLHLVKGMPQARAAALYGYTRQDVHNLIASVLKKHERLVGVPGMLVPPGFMRIEFVLPKRRVDEVRRIVTALCFPPDEKGADRRSRPRKNSP